MYAHCHSNTDNTNFQMWLIAHNWASLSLHFETCLDLSVLHFTYVMALHFNCALFFWISFLSLIYTFILQLCVIWTVFYWLSSLKLSSYSIMHKSLYPPYLRLLMPFPMALIVWNQFIGSFMRDINVWQPVDCSGNCVWCV